MTMRERLDAFLNFRRIWTWQSTTSTTRSALDRVSRLSIKANHGCVRITNEESRQERKFRQTLVRSIAIDQLTR
jgi:hypothetical protein